MPRLHTLFWLLILLCLTQAMPGVYAQDGPDPPAAGTATLPQFKFEPDLRFAHLTADDGLAQNSIEAILQDSRGFIWIGTQDGLSRFDGYTFTTYKHDPDNPASLSHNYVRDIFEDRDGFLWIATNGGGVNRFDPHTETFTPYRHDPYNPNSLGGDIIFSIFQDSRGIFWFGGPFSGLTRFDPTSATFTRFPPGQNTPGSYPGGGVWQMVEDKSGALWLAADFLIAKLDPATEQFTPYPVGLNERQQNAIYLDAAGAIWGGGTAGLYRLNPQNGQVTFFNPDDTFKVNDILPAENGMLWIASQGDGLLLFDPAAGQFRQRYLPDLTRQNSLSEDYITTLYRDKGGVIWLGTANWGLNLLDLRQSRFAHYSSSPNNPNSLAQASVETITGNNQGRLWLGTGSTLNQFDLNTGQVTHHTPTLPPQEPAALNSTYLDRQGMVWLGLSNRWLARFNPSTQAFKLYELPVKSFPPPRPTGPGAAEKPPAGPPPGAGVGPPTQPTSIYQDDSGVLWITLLRSGLYGFDPLQEKFQVYRQPDILQVNFDDPHNIINNEVNVVTGDGTGNIWLSYAIVSALSRFDPHTKTFKHYKLDIGQIGDVYIAQSGLFWLASREGLIRFDPHTEAIKRYTEKDGLPTAFVVSILEDEAGNLWLGTKKGLSHFDPHTETFRNYDVADGLQGNEFNPRAAWQAADGQMFFGGTNGLTAFYPQQISDNPYQPPVIITQLRLFNEPVLVGQNSPLTRPIWQTSELTLDHDQNILTFEFAALSYATPQKNRYRYKLEGLEDKWNEVDSARRFATYTHLEAGSYLFRVQGSNSDGIWSSQEAALKLIILPPWWETTWFRLAVLALVGGLAYGGYRWRIYRIQRQNRLLEAQVAARTRELTERTEDLARSYILLEAEISERKRAEQALLQAKAWAEERSYAAEAANRAKSAFLANMSHELRTPLNAILGFAQVMARSHNLPAEHQESIGIINRSGEHLLALINQVLDLSKIEAGQAALQERDFDLYRFLRDIEDLFRLKAESQGLQLLFERADTIPQFIRTDEMKLRQVLINLLNNALKFTKEGTVSLQVSYLPEDGGAGEQGRFSPLLPRSSAPLLYFSVDDTGPGISPDEIGQIFEAFAQTEVGRQTQEGTGLGLPISRKFVQLMGGDLTVTSVVGRGSTFQFYVQIQVVSPTPQMAQKSDTLDSPKRAIALEPGQPRYRLLIVDDSPTNRQLLVKLLGPLGFELREAENGRQALEIWEEFEPHLIWMDMRMPVLDGYEATQRIKTTTKGQATVIIALTASSFEEERIVVLSSGCDDFLRKPFREADLLAMMSKHIGVRFVYEEDRSSNVVPPPAESANLAELKSALAAVPTELVAQLVEAVELGDVELIDNLIAEIQGYEPMLAEGLARLARDFEYDRLLELSQGVEA